MKNDEKISEQDEWGKMEFVNRMRQVHCWHLTQQFYCGDATHSVETCLHYQIQHETVASCYAVMFADSGKNRIQLGLERKPGEPVYVVAKLMFCLV